ncbi:response regulator transcription factor [Brachybacterium sp. YJGR34]|uniref:response regulator n=1 Tax=Brachybacterium sp. YJGR34 TaxID=2059911 RepID=UPI000E0C04BA|nr:response regulator transcription factor [Brachybacterium sp. YJGR34]
MPAEPLRVVLADDHPIFRSGLRAVVEGAGHRVLAEAASGDEVVLAVERLVRGGERPDVVLMDLRMPGTDGVDATRAIAARADPVPVLVLTTYDTDSAILRAIEAGATGYLLKDTPAPQLLQAMTSAASGRTTLAPVAAAALASSMRSPRPEALTPRELEVLRLVGSGLTNAQIGTRLAIAESTVKSHLLRVFAKLEVEDRTRAVTLALERGLL